MIVKDGEYNSLWQLVGQLKSKEPKTILLPVHPRQSMQDSTHTPIIPDELLDMKTTNETPPLTPIDHFRSPKIQTEEQREITPSISNLQSSDYHQDNLSMAVIEDHQKRHTFAPSLYQAQQNYRELRRLLKKMNGPISKGQKTQNQPISSNRQKTKRSF
jgi:hypothetical protein